MSFEKVTSLKSSSPEKNGECRILLFWKICFFRKIGSSETVDAIQKYLLRNSSSSVNTFILNNSFVKKVAVPKSNYPKELPILKWWLLGRSFSEKKAILKKITAAKRIDCSEKEALKKQLLRKSNCWVEIITLKKCEEATTYEYHLKKIP